MSIEVTSDQDGGGFSAYEIRKARGYPVKPSIIASERIIAEERAEVERIAREGRL